MSAAVGAKLRAMTVAGVMSGTSADGVDVAICGIRPGKAADDTPKLRVLAHQGFAYPRGLRAAVLGVAGAQGTGSTSVPEIARLGWRLGQFYAECVERAVAASGTAIDLVALHGQTIYHQPEATRFLGGAVRGTWQLGEPALVAERLGVPVASDFRPADMAAGGQGAPLVPMLDFCLFRHATNNRVLLNLGGIANLTALPAGCDAGGVMAFDSGPANMVVDALTQEYFGRRFDRDGAIAARGRVLEDVVATLAAEAYFAATPPKSCGREQFGGAFVARLKALARRQQAGPADLIATATRLTSRTVLEAYTRWCWPHLGQRAPRARATDLLAAGGGTRNRTLLGQLQADFGRLGVRVGTTETNGLAPEAKEAAAFALLGWLRWHRLPGNVPSATGARRSTVLGRLT